MKHLLHLLLLISSVSLSAQQSGKLTAKQNFPKAGILNTYIYTPPKGLLIPEKSKIEIIFMAKPYADVQYPLKKTGNLFEVSFRVPDSTQVFIARVVDEKRKVLDNNNDKGYVSVLFGKDNKTFPFSNSVTAGLLNLGTYLFKLKIPSKDILQLYEAEFKLNESAKEKYYFTYLQILYRDNKEEGKSKMLEYASNNLAKE